ncbi:MAG: hypothetical protein ABJ081_02295 [Hyphomicrobiales bacterium]
MAYTKRAKSPAMTPELAGEIKYLWNTTDMNQAQIAAQLGGLNQGRVSEVISGARFSDISPSVGA